MKQFLFLLLGLALAQACGGDSSGGAPKTLPQHQIDPLTTHAEYMELVNQHRAGLGLRRLIYSEVIQGVSTDYSLTMANRGFITHMGLGKRCKRIRSEMRQGNRCGEILASGQKDAKAVFEAWLDSPDHRKAIEDPDYTHTGFGFAENGKGKLFWSQMFLEI